MAIKYKVHPELKLIVVRIEHELTAQELLGYFQLIHPDASVNECDRLLLLDALERAMPEREIAAAAHYARLSPGANTRHRTAIVAPTEFAYGVARQYQAHRHMGGRKLSIFKNLEDAADWLKLATLPDLQATQPVAALHDDYFIPMHRDNKNETTRAEEETERRATV